MAITTCVPNQAKQDFLAGVHASGDTYKIALIKVGAAGTYDANYSTYAAGMTGDEVATGGNYTQGGGTLGAPTYTVTAGVGSMDFPDQVWAAATISAIGAVIYNSSKSNKVVGVFDFGGTVTSTNGDYTVQIPGSGVGVIRIA